MKKLIRIPIYLAAAVTVPIAILAFPPVTSKISSLALEALFGKPVVVIESQLDWNNFYLYAVTDKNQTLRLSAKNLLYENRQATLHFKGNVNIYSHIATVELPFLEAEATAVYQGITNQLNATGTTLGGKIYLNLDLNNFHYTYGAKDVKLESYLRQNGLPTFASGPVSFNGKGMIQDDYYVDLNLSSTKLLLEDALVSEISSKLNYPIPAILTANIIYNDERVNIVSDLNTSLVLLSIPDAQYDINKSTYQASINIQNLGLTDIPLHDLSLESYGKIDDNNYTGRSKLIVDEHILELNDVEYIMDKNDLNVNYRLSTVKEKPLNLTGENALFGVINVKQKHVFVTLDSKVMKEPANFSMEKNKISFIANNMPLEMLFNIVNQPVLAEADLDLDFHADLGQEPFSWEFITETQNIRLEKKIVQDLNLSHPIELKVEIENNKDDILITPFIKSDLTLLNDSLLKYHTKTDQIEIDLNLKDIKVPYYTAPFLHFYGHVDLNRSSLMKSQIKTDFETIDIEKLSWVDDKINLDFNYHVQRLDRFVPLNDQYHLSGKTHLNYINEVLRLNMYSDQFGPITLTYIDNSIRVNTERLPLNEISALTLTPLMFSGDLNTSLLYSPLVIQAEIYSEQITPSMELNSSLRPFSLKSALDFKQDDNSYFGQMTLKTANEMMMLKDIIIEKEQFNVFMDYDLNITALEDATFFLPKELNGTLNLIGNLEHNKTQKISLTTHNFALPQQWHRYLDANASGPLTTSISINAEHDNGVIVLSNSINNKLISIKPLHANMNLNTKKFELKSTVLTDLWLKDMNISLQGHYDDNNSIYLNNSTIRTAAQELILKQFQFSSAKEIAGNYELKLFKTDDPYIHYHQDAILNGDFQTAPELKATLKSKSFDGTLDVTFDSQYLNVQTHQFSIPLLLAFLGKKTPLETGKIDSIIQFSTLGLLENNLTKLQGNTEIHITDLLIHGVKLDDYLVDLRDSQDLSLFNKDFKDLPIIRSVKNVASKLLEENIDTTHISDIRINMIMQSGFVSCDDCALSSEENRIAFQGSLDINSHSFQDLYVGLLDPYGCAYFIQKIEGNLRDPKIKLAAAGFSIIGGTVTSLASNVTDAATWGTGVVKNTGSFLGSITSYIPLIGKVTDKTLTGVTSLPSDATGKVIGECEPFYTGLVLHPVKKSKSK